MSKLKPCPFCGCERINVGELPFAKGRAVWCDRCGAKGGIVHRPEDDKMIIDEWNRREGEDKQRAEVERLTAQVREARKLLSYLTQFEAPHAMLFKNDYDQMRMEARMWLRANPQEKYRYTRGVDRDEGHRG